MASYCGKCCPKGDSLDVEGRALQMRQEKSVAPVQSTSELHRLSSICGSIEARKVQSPTDGCLPPGKF